MHRGLGPEHRCLSEGRRQIAESSLGLSGGVLVASGIEAPEAVPDSTTVRGARVPPASVSDVVG